jgi:hypothetical protein
MKLWTREVTGWLLLALGLYVFYRSYTLLLGGSDHQIEGAILTVMGIFLFRGGIHLLKIAVAARVCLEAQVRLDHDRNQPGAAPPPARLPAGRRSPPYAGNPASGAASAPRYLHRPGG